MAAQKRKRSKDDDPEEALSDEAKVLEILLYLLLTNCSTVFRLLT